jgi:thiosulfate reductase cytochrome b subunit
MGQNVRPEGTATMSATSMSSHLPVSPTQAIQPAWVRIAHWLNALGAILMVLSGWRIYNASPIFAFRFAPSITLGGWLGGALQWHFAVMWLLAVNGLIYLLLNLVTGRARRRFWPLSPGAFFGDLTAALKGKLSHDDPFHYNAVQKAAYVGAVALLVLLVLSGLVIWKSVQFPLLRELMGGFDSARVVHFVAMAGLVVFFVVHVVMVALVPKTLRLMVLGR